MGKIFKPQVSWDFGSIVYAYCVNIKFMLMYTMLHEHDNVKMDAIDGHVANS